MTYHGRPRGRARFAPYYKLQWYALDTLAWRDVQEHFPTPEAALSATPRLAGHRVTLSRAEHVAATIPADARWRVMEITERGRSVVAI